MTQNYPRTEGFLVDLYQLPLLLYQACF